MKFNRVALFWIFAWSIFMGVTAISIGFGALFPSMNRVAKPLVCPRGEMELETQVYRPYPGSTITTLTWYCIDQETGERTELGLFPMSLYAGVFYGLLLFAAIVLGGYLYQKWDAMPKSVETQKRAALIGQGLIFVFIAGVLLLGMLPLFRSTPSASTHTPNATATSIALRLNELSSGQPVDFTSTEKPLATWNNIPIMTEATAGQSEDIYHYSFRVAVDSGAIESFYRGGMKSLGWDLVHSQWLGMQFTKEKRTLLVTTAPHTDLQSWVVTLVLIP
jgi:hypothetical protein